MQAEAKQKKQREQIKQTKGKLIIIEAGDGSGKATQTKLLYEHLLQDGLPVRRIEFPDYASPSSALVKMYLAGDFGSHAEDVNPYAASTFFAVDRYASYRTKWQKWQETGDMILADRYVTSNMVHQAVKIEDAAAREQFLAWLDDFEYGKLGLPRPDMVIFLDMPPEIASQLLFARAQATGKAEDIHEQDADYLALCHALYQDLAERYGWLTVKCNEGRTPRPPEAIHQEVYAAVQKGIAL